MNGWKLAEASVRKLAHGLPVYWGTGYPVETPCVIASTMDAWSGEGMGFNVKVCPNGEGCGKPYSYYKVTLDGLIA